MTMRPPGRLVIFYSSLLTMLLGSPCFRLAVGRRMIVPTVISGSRMENCRLRLRRALYGRRFSDTRQQGPHTSTGASSSLQVAGLDRWRISKDVVDQGDSGGVRGIEVLGLAHISACRSLERDEIGGGVRISAKPYEWRSMALTVRSS
jgi:hypothetical protein